MLLAKIDRALESVGQLVPLDDARFLATHRTFENSSGQRELIIDWFRRHIAEQVAKAGKAGARRILSIGCGDGSVDVPIARALTDKFGSIDYVGVDPNAAELQQYDANFAAADLPGVTATANKGTFAAFEANGLFDHIHCVHSLYYMPDPASSLARALGLLAEGGELVLFHAPRQELNALTSRFYDKQYGRKTLFADDFAAVLDATDYSYQCERIDARIDVTAMFGNQQAEAHALRDFILQFDSRSMPVAVTEPVERYLRLIADGTRSSASIAHPVDVFVIRRAPKS
ncbi:MAG: SAM-dependent methyltransferase [Planctomycetota bacterium]